MSREWDRWQPPVSIGHRVYGEEAAAFGSGSPPGGGSLHLIWCGSLSVAEENEFLSVWCGAK